MESREMKAAAEQLGAMMLRQCKPAIVTLARTLVVDTGLVPKAEQETEIAKLTADFERRFAPALVEFGAEILGMIEKTQMTTIEAVVRYMAEEGHAIRDTDTAFYWFARIVRGLQAGDWKKHVALSTNPSEKPS